MCFIFVIVNENREVEERKFFFIIYFINYSPRINDFINVNVAEAIVGGSRWFWNHGAGLGPSQFFCLFSLA